MPFYAPSCLCHKALMSNTYCLHTQEVSPPPNTHTQTSVHGRLTQQTSIARHPPSALRSFCHSLSRVLWRSSRLMLHRAAVWVPRGPSHLLPLDTSSKVEITFCLEAFSYQRDRPTDQTVSLASSSAIFERLCFCWSCCLLCCCAMIFHPPFPSPTPTLFTFCSYSWKGPQGGNQITLQANLLVTRRCSLMDRHVPSLTSRESYHRSSTS